jgi:hypothetical protein
MKADEVDWVIVGKVVKEIAEAQRKQLLSLGRRIIPTLTAEDVLQPNDYPELEHDPQFRYEEGFLAGVQTVEMALRNVFKRKKQDRQDCAAAGYEG